MVKQSNRFSSTVEKPTMTTKRKSDGNVTDNANKKIKLSAPRPTTDNDEQPTDRPRRRSIKPSRFSEVAEKATSPSPSPSASDGPPTDARSSVEPTALDGEAPYGADFLLAYLDEPLEPEPKSAVTKSVKKRKSITSQTARSKDKTPEAESKGSKKTIKLNTRPASPPRSRKSSVPANSEQETRESQPAAAQPTQPEEPTIIDDEPIIIKKISHAVHALGNLNIPSPAHPLITPTELSDKGIDKLLNAGENVDSGNQSEANMATIVKRAQGTVDHDLRVLIRNAVHLLRTSLVTKVQLQAANAKPRGRPKRDGVLKTAIDADRFAMSALEAVATSNAININCIMSAQRANLLWHLYMSLLFLVAPAPPPPPPPPPQHMMHMPMQGPPPQHQGPDRYRQMHDQLQQQHQQQQPGPYDSRSLQSPPTMHTQFQPHPNRPHSRSEPLHPHAPPLRPPIELYDRSVGPNEPGNRDRGIVQAARDDTTYRQIHDPRGPPPPHQFLLHQSSDMTPPRSSHDTGPMPPMHRTPPAYTSPRPDRDVSLPKLGSLAPIRHDTPPRRPGSELRLPSLTGLGFPGGPTTLPPLASLHDRPGMDRVDGRYPPSMRPRSSYPPPREYSR